MPRSKRSKLVTLSKTEAKTRESKEKIFDSVREALDTFQYVWVLQLDDVRTPVLQEIRSQWVGSRLIMGKRKVLIKALGDTRENEYKENLYKLSKGINGVVGLLFTNEDVDTVTDYFTAYEKNDYSRAGSLSPIEFVIPQGIVYSRGGQIPIEDDVPMVHSLEPTLRNKFEIPTKIVKGKIFLDQPYKVCSRGEKLDVRQSLILKQFGIAESKFKIKIQWYYDIGNSEVKEVDINLNLTN